MAKQTFTTGQVLTAAQMTSLQQTAMLGGAASAKTASYTLVAADAGTAISMSNAGATTITVNTALFAAGDTVQITNLGAGVCTITAGTATVNTSASLALAQYESGTLNFTSTSAAIFIKGAGAAAGGASFKGVSLWQSSDISLANDTTVALTWNSENFDTDAFHSTSTNTGRITIPSALDGKYHINGAISFAGGGAGFRRVDVLKNGTVFIYGANIASASASGGTQMIPFSVLLDLVATDYVSISVSQASGGTINTLGGQAFGQFNATFLGA